MERILVDFNTMTQDEGPFDSRRVRIPKRFAEPYFREGLRVLIYDKELQAEANLEYDGEMDMWLVLPDWSTRRDLPDA